MSSRPMRSSDRSPTVRQEIANELISLANLLHRPILDHSKEQICRVTDVMVSAVADVAHPLVTGIVVSLGKTHGLLDIGSVELQQVAGHMSSTSVLLDTAALPADQGALFLARDVLDHQLVDIHGVQIVRAADVFLVLTGDGWVLGGVDVGVWSFFRRLFPRSSSCPPPSRFIDWANLYPFVPRREGDETERAQPSIQVAASVNELRRLKAVDVARLLQGASRHHQAQLAMALKGSPSATKVLRELEGPRLDALLAELDSDDRERLLSLIRENRERT